MTAPEYRAEMTIRFTIWDQITGVTGRPTTA
jgi:putative transposase